MTKQNKLEVSLVKTPFDEMIKPFIKGKIKEQIREETNIIRQKLQLAEAENKSLKATIKMHEDNIKFLQKDNDESYTIRNILENMKWDLQHYIMRAQNLDKLINPPKKKKVKKHVNS